MVIFQADLNNSTITANKKLHGYNKISNEKLTERISEFVNYLWF